jgi:hypothetical protein
MRPGEFISGTSGAAGAPTVVQTDLNASVLLRAWSTEFM